MSDFLTHYLTKRTICINKNLDAMNISVQMIQSNDILMIHIVRLLLVCFSLNGLLGV